MMEKENVQGSHIYYEPTDKCFWAAFYNLARHNAYLTVAHINSFVNSKKRINNDDKVLDVIDDWSKFDDDLLMGARLNKLILKHFPFLKAPLYELAKQEALKQYKKEQQKYGKKGKKKEVFIQEAMANAFKMEDVRKILREFLQQLEDLRNHFSHYNYNSSDEKTEVEFDDGFCNKLYYVFDAALQMVKDDNRMNPEINMQTDFSHLVRLGRKGEISRSFKYKFIEPDGTINNNGLLFFVSLFLEKRDAIWMQKKIKGFKGGTENYMRMTNEVFCRNRMAIPKLRLETDYDNHQLMFDMLNELVRCPLSLYKRLKQEDQDKFQVPIEFLDEDNEADNQYQENANSDENPTEETDPLKNTLVRHQHRFPYFVLRYFDLNEVFKQLRFQINLGCYHFSIYDKTIGERTEKRHLTRTLFGFDRLQNFSVKLQPQHWKNMVKHLDTEESSDKPYLSDAMPHYQIENEKIGIHFLKTDTEKKETVWPSLEVEEVSSNRNKYKSEKNLTADAFLSTHELLPMMFYYQLLSSEEKTRAAAGGKVQGVLQSYRKKIFDIYDDFANGTINSMQKLDERLEKDNLLRGNMPQQMLAILERQEPDMEQKAKEKLDLLITETEERIDKLNAQFKQKVRIGKRRAGLPKVGSIADWLVNDMMRFQPAKRSADNTRVPGSKANSTEYRLLQEALAFYSTYKDRLEPYFRQVNLIGDTNPHPFLHRVDWKKCNHLLSFYHDYLEAKKRYLSDLSPADWQKHQHFLLLKVRKDIQNEKKDWKKSLVAGWKNGFNLPRGLFTESIKTWFSTHADKVQITDPKLFENRVGLIAKLIPLYYNKVYDDKPQPFYQYPFNINDRYKPKDAHKQFTAASSELWKKKKALYKDSQPSQFEEVKYLQYLDFLSWKKLERELRMLRNQDMMVWLMCKDIFSQCAVKEVKFADLKLSQLKVNVVVQGNLNILNSVSPMILPLSVYPLDAQGNVLRNSKPLYTVYVQEKNTKLLKQGNFKSLLKDRRLNGLFSFITAEGEDLQQHPLTKNRLEYELSIYQTMRISVFEQTLQLEKAILTRNKTLCGNNFNNLLNSWSEHRTDKKTLQPDIDFLIAVRNAFSHNQYPMSTNTVMQGIEKFNIQTPKLEEKDGLGIASQLAKKTKDAASRLQNIINGGTN